MKKKILLGIFALALLGISGYGLSSSIQSDIGLSDLALRNVEALASNESPGIGQPGENYKYVTLFETATERKCINSRFYIITYYDSDCYWEGNVPCPGPHYVISETGYCT